MTTWIAVLIVGLGSYALRAGPLLLGPRLRLAPRTQDALRHAGMAGITAIAVTSVTGMTATGGVVAVLSVGAAVTIAATLALRGRSMTLVVLAGGVGYAAVALGAAAFAS